MPSTSTGPYTVTYQSPRWRAEWAIPEVPVPESNTHDLAIEYLRSVLLAWAARAARSPMIARNLGIRWISEEPRCGFDPDLCLIEPAPPERHLSTLRLWRPEHAVPWLAIEVVSPGHPYKDYADTPERCAASGVGELWIFDPLLAGPKRGSGPYPLQIWAREQNEMRQVHAAGTPGYSPALNAWVHPTTVDADARGSQAPSTGEGAAAKLRLSDAEVGGQFWPTLAEQELSSAHAELSRERQARRELERQLEELRRNGK